MNDLEKWRKELSEKINALQYKQQELNDELQKLQKELNNLKIDLIGTTPISVEKTEAVVPKAIIERSAPVSEIKQYLSTGKFTTASKPIQEPFSRVSNQKIEDFIGSNLISKIGILITIIGIFIGAKYAIDKDLISPAMRIISGYTAGLVLILTAIRLKIKYENFSAVLMGGGLAVLYFITYIGYGFYQLFPQVVSFLLMVAITVSAVFIALWYNQKIIAILGQIAAYAIPFLLSDGSGKVVVLFSYISIINIGLLILSFRRDWKILYRLGFFLTWIIYASWLLFKGHELTQASTGLVFLFINFFTFYATFLSYKILKRELYNVTEIAVLLINALLFFFSGAYLIGEIFTEVHILTHFTIVNSVIHFATGFIIYKLKLADKSVYQFIAGLGIVFFTIAIPVELDGSWVTLLWSFEATILCHIALKNNRQSFLDIALPMVIIAILSLLQDWLFHYHLNNFERASYTRPFINHTFCFSLIVSACLGYISWISAKVSMNSRYLRSAFFKNIMPFVFFFTLYFTFFNEINFAWNFAIRKNNSAGENIIDARIYFQQLSLMIYSFLYCALWMRVNNKYFKRKSATMFLLTAGILCVAYFLFGGLVVIGDLRENYLLMKARNFNPSLLMLYVRYICSAALAVLIWNGWNEVKDTAERKVAVNTFSSIFNLVLLSVICNEFIHWMHLGGHQNQYKLGLSIICGLYAFVLISVGIVKKARHFRIAAIVLFGVTLIKLFFYDLAMLSAISKTVVLVILGILLLIISFLYNKYKGIIFSEEDEANTYIDADRTNIM